MRATGCQVGGRRPHLRRPHLLPPRPSAQGGAGRPATAAAGEPCQRPCGGPDAGSVPPRARKLAGGNPDAGKRDARTRARRQGRAMRRHVLQKLQGEGGQGFEGTAGVPSFPALLPRHARARALANARRRACRAGVAGVPRAQPAVCRPACLRDLAPCGRRFEWILRLLLSPS